MIIHSKLKDYEVQIHNDLSFVKDILEMENTFFVIDQRVSEIYGELLFQKIDKDKLLLLDALEENKTIATAMEICEKMTQISAKRNATLVSFGGGIIQDITGFAANILYRGIHWIYCPTTLLAACDSCIGGKTSLNYKHYKNLLGTFYPPDCIYISPRFFETLSEADYKSGMGEVVKFNIMRGEKGLRNIEDKMQSLLARDRTALIEVVVSSLLFKKGFIEEDEFDYGVRVQLNFAHTFGHAFEVMSQYQIPHGTAVAMGTIVADRISLSRKMMSSEMAERIEHVLWKIINVDIQHMEMNIDTMISIIRKDKKQIDANLTAVLMNQDKKLSVVHDLQPEETKEAVAYLWENLAKHCVWEQL